MPAMRKALFFCVCMWGEKWISMIRRSFQSISLNGNCHSKWDFPAFCIRVIALQLYLPSILLPFSLSRKRQFISLLWLFYFVLVKILSDFDERWRVKFSLSSLTTRLSSRNLIKLIKILNINSSLKIQPHKFLVEFSEEICCK